MRRESILTRIWDILKATPELRSTGRNRGLIPQEQRPTGILLDGSERSALPVAGRGRRAVMTNIMIMSPQVLVIFEARLPRNDRIGQDLNALCGTVLGNIARDAQLVTLVTSNGSIGYTGIQTDLQLNAPLEGRALIGLEIHYPFDPRE